MENNAVDIKITDEDITWIESIFPDILFDNCRIEILKNMDSIDIHACPGSGKTTLLVAKLAILAKKWPYHNRGICVLSHTNVAREEIQERLGKLEVGRRLLSYPHFIGTFQSFFDNFLAIPMLKSCGNPVTIVDTEFVTEKRWKNLRYKKWFENNYKDQFVCDPISLPYGFDVKCGEESKTYKDLVRVTSASRKKGEFTFREMESFAARCIEKKPIVSSIIQNRFPVLFIDEAQDTKIEIWNMIEALNKDAEKKSIYQAYGDENQAIFNSYESMQKIDKFPRKNALQMLNSKRFVPAIAALANGVSLDKSQMTGEYEFFENKNIRNTIFLFKQGEEEKVIEQYAKLILASFTDKELEENAKYGCHVLGLVHKLNETDDDIEFAKRVSNYNKDYNPDCKKTSPTQLIDYFYIADEKFAFDGELSWKVEYISKGILKFIKKYETKEIKNSHNAFKSLVGLFNDDEQQLLRKSLYEIILMDWYFENSWNNVVQRILTVFADYIDMGKAQKSSYIKWYGATNITQEKKIRNIPNQITYFDEHEKRSLDIKFGSIHSSKGRTHLATLIVETFNHEYNMKSILPWLEGKEGKKGKRNDGRLKCQYVAMTRAKGLICLAIPNEFVTKQERKALESFGWNIEVL